MTIRHYILFIWVLIVLVAGCSSSKETIRGYNAHNNAPELNYTLIFIIHGDASYLYHEEDGTARQADEKVLRQAWNLARKAKHGEVFIFHQRPERKVLWLFPKKDRAFYYYRNGRLIHKERYSPSGMNIFSTERKLFWQLEIDRQALKKRKKVFLYFGHEIPYKEGTNYFKSLPSLRFNVHTFSKALASFLPAGNMFDLTVLSTCNNGTPSMAQELSPYSRYLLASPQNLHLSHIDIQKLRLLEDADNSIKHIAEAVATATYRRLSKSVQTVVSLSLYDLPSTASYINSFVTGYSAYLSNSSAYLTADNEDCKLLPFFNPSYTSGIEEWYRPPHFGRKAGKRNFSGWGCKVIPR